MRKNDPYTPIHNEVLEALATVNLSPYETRVLMATWRLTYGWRDEKTGERKRSARITLAEFEKATKLDRRLVSRSLQGLKAKGVISRDDSMTTGFSKAFMRKMGHLAQVPRISQSVSSVRQTGLESIAEILKRKSIKP